LREYGPLNLPSNLLGHQNSVYSGTGTRYSTGEVEGWLSIKMVLSGSAVWETAERRFTVDENCYLILNDRHRYTLRMDSGQKATTFVLFFRRGFVEDVFRGMTISAISLLDKPEQTGEALGFFERLEPLTGSFGELMRKFQLRLEARPCSLLESDDWFTRVAARMVREHGQTNFTIARLPAVRASTRAELYRRVLRGRDFLLERSADHVSLADVAREACLSPYHFHRVFHSAFRCSPHEYLTRRRLDGAARLLRETSRSVTDVCLDVGFESLGSFSTLFRRHFGVSPRVYRQSAGKIRKIREEHSSVSA
jgi:AraC-like DNA-binding protein